ncbi:unnamed protein product [Heterobilharzia americana]|nr:unnamed protein product [Heterobilharzia americana]
MKSKSTYQLVKLSFRQFSLVYIYPLTETIPLCLPKMFTEVFISKNCHLFPYPSYCSKDKIIRKLSKISSTRRAELLYEQVLNKQYDNDIDEYTRMQHQTRQCIQTRLYDYVLNDILGLYTIKCSLDNFPYLLDLGCGYQSVVTSRYSAITLSSSSSSSLANNTFFPICIDLFNSKLFSVPNYTNSRIVQLLKCNLAKQYSSSINHIIPLRDNSIDYIISISFLQWLLIYPKSWMCIDYLMHEITRLLIDNHLVNVFYNSIH